MALNALGATHTIPSLKEKVKPLNFSSQNCHLGTAHEFVFFFFNFQNQLDVRPVT